MGVIKATGLNRIDKVEEVLLCQRRENLSLIQLLTYEIFIAL
jgi:hypothetical protein